MNVSVDVKVTPQGGASVATVRVVQGRERTEHRVTVTPEDLARYGATDVKDLVHRSFVFLLAREPNTSIRPEFGISEIERYFPQFGSAIRPKS